ncbi:M23 family metallopeptidase [Winogradskyella sp. A3E31]|uniref:M23 family metallopeptidase n=1 Tax=Winogradskyella sp. A3E31 TaxID=3349637 RepID=UPI00398ABBBA
MKTLYVIIIFLGSLHLSLGQSIKSDKRISNDSVHIDLINPFYVPMELRLSALDSTKDYTDIVPYYLLKEKDTLKNAIVLPIKKVNDTSSINIKKYINFKASFGNPKSSIDYNYEYSLPYPKGKKYKIIQSFGGKFSHNMKHSKYAIDFGTQIGDTITAIRPGIVFFVKEDSNEHCRTRRCVNKANKIMILHNDGSIASYVHLDVNGVLVNEGDEILEGQPIGISGFTGFTTKPHLHLVIYKSGSESIPFYFKGQKQRKLKQGKSYKRNI